MSVLTNKQSQQVSTGQEESLRRQADTSTQISAEKTVDALCVSTAPLNWFSLHKDDQIMSFSQEELQRMKAEAPRLTHKHKCTVG